MASSVDVAATVDCRCLAARRTARALTRLYEEHLRPHGLRATQFSILAALALKGPTPVSELANALGLERTTLTRSATLLERNGWVRSGRPEDARIRPLHLTPTGREKLEAALPAWQAAQDIASRELGGLENVRGERSGRKEHLASQEARGFARMPARFPGRVATDQAGWQRECLRQPRLFGAPLVMNRTAA